MTKQEMLSDEQKLEALALWEIEEWNTTEASKCLGVGRATLLGWRSSKEHIDERTTFGIKSRPGPESSTHGYEYDLVNMIKLSNDIDAKMTTGVIVDYCSDKIPGFKKRSSGAQLSWLNRFIKRHELREYIATYDFSAQPSKKKLKLSLSEVSTASSETILHVEAPSQDNCAVVDSSNPTPKVQSAYHIPLDPKTTLDATPSPALAVISLVDDTKKVWTLVMNMTKAENVRLVVQKSDLRTLEDQNWLNDVVITYYIRKHISPHGRTYIMDANLFAHIFARFKASGRNMKTTYRSYRGITASFPYDKYDCVIIPVSMGNHWAFVVVQNPVLAVDNLRRCIVHVDSLGISKIETIKRIVGGYFDEELRAKFTDRPVKPFVVRSIQTKPKQTNSDDCGVFVLFFMKRVIEAFLRNDVLLLLDIDKICTVSRSTEFNPAMFRKEIIKVMSS
ncbi:unnamed protein product [Phytophthora fragariaefolia]|uniref:Unnamed protein product n=1 Tax=Phytophthora fragariaefolia TaxID=1490495 RepID=A0A9W6WQX2_9STRA|nr:unnamed protein product [Phytophthora fragariaefolia]